MKRILLVFLCLFAFTLSQAQIIFNEFYVEPGTNEEYFELYNTSTTEIIKLDCYSLVVLYSGKDRIGNKDVSYKGFYVLDFPDVEIGPLGYLVGAAADPFKYQKSGQAPVELAEAAFSWNDPNLASKGGSLKSYKSYEPYTSYSVVETITSNNTFNLLFGNGQSASDVKYGFFLFKNGVYVNGFMAGYGNTTVPTDITSMPLLELRTNCNGAESITTVDWLNDVKSGEFVIEASGKDNGYVRTRDGKCGEWEKSSNPYTSNGYEHSPNETNGSATIDETNALSITTERTLCGTRIDYSITGIIRDNRYNTEAVFPLVVQLYKDVDGDGTLDPSEPLLADRTITSASEEFYSFTGYWTKTDPAEWVPMSSDEEYIVVFRTALGCIDKVVSPPPASIEATQTVYCGNQIDFTINRALYDANGPDGSINFTAQVYVDNGKIGTYEPGTDMPIPDMTFSISRFNETVTKLLTPGYEKMNYIVVYTSVSGGCTIESAFKAQPSKASLTTVYGYTCGDPVGGDVLLFDVQAISDAVESREFPLQVDLYYDNTSNGQLGEWDDKDVIQHSFTIDHVADDPLNFRPAYGQPIILVYRSKRGCAIQIDYPDMQCSTLPVTFRSFTAERHKQTVSLKWETATEQNNRGFYVQRNTRGIWENAAFVPSAALGGNSNGILAYSYSDINTEKGISQYRIQQVDMDTKASFSAIRSVRGEGQENRMVVYPNPSQDGKVNLVFEGLRSVTVSDMSGRVVRQYHNRMNSLQIDGLESGMYNIQVTDLSSGESTTEKVIIK